MSQRIGDWNRGKWHVRGSTVQQVQTFRVAFEGSQRVERLRADSYRLADQWVEFVVEEGTGLDLSYRVVATFDGREIARITTVA